ncbi:MAG: DUF2778 domain-containing protein [Lentimicrobiaceae bacterium]|jgi:hypothetical protein|nr:DUF2778 domain-containing protein [Lentimicrobiaceae bacterium]
MSNGSVVMLAVLGGGKFANGAVTGAFVMLFNHLQHEPDKNAVKAKERQGIKKSTYYLRFDGKELHVIDPVAKDKIYSTSATSGKEVGMNNIDYQDIPFIGPIPEGIYSFENTNWQSLTKWQQYKRLLAGGDWGSHNVRLDIVVNNSTRNGFFLHGGIFKGSAGCIDVGSNIGRIYELTKDQKITYIFVYYK